MATMENMTLSAGSIGISAGIRRGLLGLAEAIAAILGGVLFNDGNPDNPPDNPTDNPPNTDTNDPPPPNCGPGGGPDKPSLGEKLKKTLKTLTVGLLGFWGDNPAETGYQNDPSNPWDPVVERRQREEDWERGNTDYDNSKGPDDDTRCP